MIECCKHRNNIWKSLENKAFPKDFWEEETYENQYLRA